MYSSNSHRNESLHFVIEPHLWRPQLVDIGANRIGHDVSVSGQAIIDALVSAEDFSSGKPRLYTATFFVGFVLLSVLMADAPVGELSLSTAQEQVFVGLCGSGFLLQLLFGQRLTVGEELVVERFVTGEFLRFKKSDITAIEIYRSALNPRQKQVQLRLRSGDVAKLDFGQDIVSELREWIGVTEIWRGVASRAVTSRDL